MRLHILLLLLWSYVAHAEFLPVVAQGQWVAYVQQAGTRPSYYFLAVDEDYSGIFVRCYEGDAIRHPFSRTDFTFRDGYFELSLNKSMKAIFSAWKLASGRGLLTGIVFMYKPSGELFNMLPFSLRLVQSSVDFADKPEIKALIEEFAPRNTPLTRRSTGRLPETPIPSSSGRRLASAG